MGSEILLWVIGGIVGLLAFFGKRTLNMIEETQKDHTKEINNIKLEYLHKNDFREFKQELRMMFEGFKQDIKSMLNHEKD